MPANSYSSFEIKHDEPMFGFDGGVLSTCAFAFVRRSLKTMLPVTGGPFSFEPNVVSRLKTQRDRRGLQSFEQQPTDRLIEFIAGQTLARRFAVINGSATARITQPPTAVTDRHTASATAALHESGK